jgi:hypothetical protein
METGVDFLERLRVAVPPHTAYRVATVLDVPKVRVNQWRAGRGNVTVSLALPIAELLGISPAYVLACLCHERAYHKQDMELLARLAAQYRDAPAPPPKAPRPVGRKGRPPGQSLRKFGRRAGDAGTVEGSTPADAR